MKYDFFAVVDFVRRDVTYYSWCASTLEMGIDTEMYTPVRVTAPINKPNYIDIFKNPSCSLIRMMPVYRSCRRRDRV